MPEPEAELLATADLSPVSPSPVHSAAAQVVPALQDTVDTIDAMVAAAAAAAAHGTTDSAPDIDLIMASDDIDDVVDDDSLNDPYGEVETESAAPEPQPQLQQELPDSSDDYAKTFDSPINPEEGEGEDIQPEDVSSIRRESNDISLASDHLTSRPSESSHAVPETSISAQQGPPTAPSAHPEASIENATSRPPNVDPVGSHTAPSPSTAKAESSYAGSPNPSADAQRLAEDLTTHAEPNSNSDPNAPFARAEPFAGSGALPSALPSSASLPPRPPLPHSVSQSYASQHHPAGSNSSVPANIAPPTPGQPSTYVAAGAPGISTDALGGLPPNLTTGLNAPVAITSMTAPPYPSHSPTFSTDRGQDTEYQRQWDQFMTDERQYMSEAKWDRFPEGSRIFIGNLSSDKVSKRDVFDMFHRFGRLAQISLKSAYGFVQYHTIDEGRRAMENLQGIEIKGRRIHLEISRVQEKAKKERVRSPDRGRGRDGGRDSGRDGGRDSGRRNERYGQQSRDDYRPSGRNHSPRRNEYQRDDGYGRDRGFSYDGGRGKGRSRSPGYGRNDKESYRRRSPSPYGRSRQDDDLDIPRRYGADVPDVQIILQPDVRQDFVNWVIATFTAKGLRSEQMYLHPRFPKEKVIQRQAAEGVHALVDLDLRAQGTGRIPVQTFDRSAGTGLSNVRFDQYVDLDPQTAADLIIRAKASGAAASYTQSYGGASGYSNSYPQQPQQGHPPPFSGGPQSNQYQPPRGPPAAAPIDVASLMGQMDNATLQRLLATIQPGSQGGMPGATPHAGLNPAAAANPQVDIQAILGSLSGTAAAQQQVPAQGPYGQAYGAPPAPNGGAPQNGDAAVQVQNIMAQLARFRQQ